VVSWVGGRGEFLLNVQRAKLGFVHFYFAIC
jgi:hypothetical protein